MANTETQHELISALKSLKQKLNKTPTKYEFHAAFRGAEYRLKTSFGTYTKLLAAAGLLENAPPTHKEAIKQDRAYKKICSHKEQIEGFYRHVIDLKDLFERAGNPPVLKLSAAFDVHAKFVDPGAWKCFIEFLRYYKPDVLLFGGDFLDCEGLSHWEPSDLAPRRIVPEAKVGRAMLAEAKEAAANPETILYIEGNHEDWIKQAMAEMPEMFEGLDELGIEINLQTLLNFKGLGIDFFPLNDLVKIGKAHFTHGLYAGQNHAAKHLKELMTNIYYGHVHDTQEVNDVGVDGPVEAACGGCLCRLDAKFLKGKKNKWAHAFMNFEFFPDGSYTVYRMRIIGGKLAYNGQTFGT